MDTVARQVQSNAKKVVVLQITIAALVALVFGILQGGLMPAISGLYGGLISVSTSWLLRRGVLKANEIAQHDPKSGMTVLYIGAVQRFVLVVALLGLGLGLLDLDPLAAVVGFGLAQVAYAIVMRMTAHPGRRR